MYYSYCSNLISSSSFYISLHFQTLWHLIAEYCGLLFGLYDRVF
jgi:hypothetical protein